MYIKHLKNRRSFLQFPMSSKNGQKSYSFSAHYGQHFKPTTPRTDLHNCMIFRVVNKLILIGAMKDFKKPNLNLCMEECLTIIKVPRDKNTILMNKRLNIYRDF